MKPKTLRPLAASLIFVSSSAMLHAVTGTWDGGGANGNWGTALNWTGDAIPAFDNVADIKFYQTGAANLTNYLSADRTIRSLEFTADAAAAVTIRTRNAAGGAQVGRILTFDSDSGNASITVTSTAAVNHTISGGTVTAASVGTGGSIALVDSLDVVHNAASTQTLTIGQNNDGVTALSETPITGDGGINKSGTGTLVIAGPNTFAGGVNITGGRVNITNSTALGTGAVTLGGTGAILRLAATGVSTPSANTLTVSDAGDTKTLEGLVTSGVSTFGGNISILETTAGNFQVSGGASHTLTVSGDISGTTAAGIKKSSSGIVVLSGNNSYTGDTEVSNGTLKIGSATAIPSGTGKGNMLVNSGGTFGGILDLNGFDLTVNGLSGGSAAVLGQIVNDGAGTKSLTVGAGDATGQTYSSLIKDNSGTGGTVAIIKTGTGEQTFAGANTYSGGTTVNVGRLTLNHSSAAGTGSITLGDTGSQVQTGGGVTVGNNLTVSDTGDTKTLRHFNVTAATYSGNITSNETTEGNFWIQVGTGAALTITGDISDPGGAGITKINPGTLNLTGAKSYTGTTTVSGGILSVDTAFFADASSVKIGTGAVLNLNHVSTDTIDKLYINGVQQAAGLYSADGSGGSTALPELTGTGKLQVTTSPVLDPYNSWASQITNAADRDRADDPDGDGLTNLQEYLFGTSPISGTENLSTTETSGSNLIVRWKELVSGGTYTLMESSTLNNDWVTATGATLANDGAAAGGYQPRMATIAIGSSKKFFRVQGVEN